MAEAAGAERPAQLPKGSTNFAQYKSKPPFPPGRFDEKMITSLPPKVRPAMIGRNSSLGELRSLSGSGSPALTCGRRTHAHRDGARTRWERAASARRSTPRRGKNVRHVTAHQAGQTIGTARVIASAAMKRARSGKRRTLLALSVAALMAPGCDFICARKQVPAARDAAADDAPVGVEVVTPGAEPRTKLEVGRWTGLHYELEQESDGSFGRTGAASIKAPTLVLKTTVDVLRGTADPLIQERDGKRLRLVEERATLDRISLRSEGGPADFIAKANEMLALLKGMTTKALIAENGEVTEVTTEHVGGVVPPPEVKSFLDEALSAQRYFPLRLPPTPVGVGARWRFSVPLESRGIKSLQVADMTLVELTASTARIGVRVRHQATKQEVPHPTYPGLRATLSSLRGDADGEITLDRLTACILVARFSSTSYQTMTWVDESGEDQTATFMHANVQRLRGRVGAPFDGGDFPDAGAGAAADAAEPTAPPAVPEDEDETE